MRKSIVAFAAIITGTLLASGCASPAAGPSGAGSTDESSVVGTWGDSTAANSPYLKLEENGELIGSDGCNGLNGTYSPISDGFSVKLGMSTLMACPGVETWLRNVASIRVDGDTLVVLDRGNDEIGTLTRSAA